MSALRKLTDRTVASAGPREREYHLSDGACPGLQLRVRPSGHRSWRLGYHAAGRKVWLTLGEYPALKLADARRRAEAHRLTVAEGRDPARELAQRRRQAAGEWTVGTLFGTGPEDLGWYLSEYVATAGRGGEAKAKASIATDRGYLRKHLWHRKSLLRARVADVGASDLAAVQRDCKPGAWRKVRAILRIGFAHAEKAGQIPRASNPACETKATPDRKVERYLTAEERQRFEAALADAEAIGPARRAHPGGTVAYVPAVLRLLSLTGARLSEITGLRWEWVDLNRAEINLPTSKTGARRIPLTPQATAFIRKLRGPAPRIGPVFVGRLGGPAHPSTVKRAWREILRVRADLADVRIHDLRHAFASDAISAGIPLATVAVILGHSLSSTTERYAHLQDSALREGLAVIGQRIESATRGSK